MYLAYKKSDKEKMRDRVSELMVLEKKLSLVEYVSPMIETIQTQAKTLRKEKKCPEDLLKEVSTMIYLADILNIPAFLRVKNQLTFKYGEKFIDKVCGKKHVGVDEEVVNMIEYSPDSKAVKARTAELKEKCKVREKDEEKAKKRAEKKKTGKGSKKHHHKKADSSSDDSESEEKPKKKSKKSKKEESNDDSSANEKPKKKSKKPKKAESSDSDSSDEKSKKTESSEKPKELESASAEVTIEKPIEVPEKTEDEIVEPNAPEEKVHKEQPTQE